MAKETMSAISELEKITSELGSSTKKRKKPKKTEEKQKAAIREEKKKKRREEFRAAREEAKYYAATEAETQEEIDEYSKKLEYFNQLFQEVGHKINIYRLEPGERHREFIDSFMTDGKNGISELAFKLPVTTHNHYLFQHIDNATGKILNNVSIKYDKDYYIRKYNERRQEMINFEQQQQIPNWFMPSMPSMPYPPMQNMEFPEWMSKLQDNQHFQKNMINKMFGSGDKNNMEMLQLVSDLQRQSMEREREMEKKFYEMQMQMLQQSMNQQNNRGDDGIYKLMINQSNMSNQQMLTLVSQLVKNAGNSGNISEMASTMKVLKDLFADMNGDTQNDGILAQVMPGVQKVLELYSLQQANKLQQNQNQQALPAPQQNVSGEKQYTESEVRELMEQYRRETENNLSAYLSEQQPPPPPPQQQQQQQQPQQPQNNVVEFRSESENTQKEKDVDDMKIISTLQLISNEEFSKGLFDSISKGCESTTDFLIDESEKNEKVHDMIELILEVEPKSIITAIEPYAKKAGITITEGFIRELKKEIESRIEDENSDVANDSNNSNPDISK